MREFQRARQPDQIDVRRETLLAAAAELFDTQGPMGAGLNAIAAKAGFTKSNIYRYFESREDVLLALFLNEFNRLSATIVARLEVQPVGDIDCLAEAIASSLLAQPRCCHLMSIFSSVLEQNVSEATIERVKRHIKERTEDIIGALANKLPNTREEDCGWVVAMTVSLVAGLWPGAHPSVAAAAVMAKPEFSQMLLRPESDIKRAISAFLSSVVMASGNSR